MTPQWYECWCADGRIARDNEWPFVDSFEDVATHDIERSSRGGHHALGQKDYVIGEAGDEVQLVTHDENGSTAARQSGQKLEASHLVGDVEEGGGFIEDE